MMGPRIVSPRILAKFVSVWDSGLEIPSHCMLNVETSEVTDIEMSPVVPPDDDILLYEYVETEDTGLVSKVFQALQKDEYDSVSQEEKRNYVWYD